MAIDDGTPSSNLLPVPHSPQRHAGGSTSQLLPLASPSRAGAILSGIGSAVAGVIRAFSPPRAPPPPSELIGASPFDLSLVDSSISTTTMIDDASIISSVIVQKETDTTILQLMANDQEEEGDGGDSDVEGGEVDLHHNVMLPATRRIDEHFRSIDNEIDIDEWGEQFTPALIPGAPDGWIPPSTPINFPGYVPKLDAPLVFDDVDNPAGWDQFVFQAKYAVEKGKKAPRNMLGTAHRQAR